MDEMIEFGSVPYDADVLGHPRFREVLLGLDLSGDEGEVRELARGADGEVSGLAWSPDSQWLAYAGPVEAGIDRIAMMRPTDGVPVAVTEPRFVDRSPTHKVWVKPSVMSVNLVKLPR